MTVPVAGCWPDITEWRPILPVVDSADSLYSVPMHNSTDRPPLTVHRLDSSSPVPLLGSSYRWVIKQGENVVGFFGTRKQAEQFIALSKTDR